jgi:hypothetical protein
MFRRNLELWLALAVILLSTFAYGYVLIATKHVPSASGWFGHVIGALGFALMLMTEILYSIRKRSRFARWGRTSSWLRFHIFTGIVGPYLVLLHTSWKFHGLAGISLFFTIVIVISGFIGRYLYTAIPRNPDGLEIDSEQNTGKQRLLALWHSVHIPLGLVLFTAAFIHIYAALYYATLLR